VSDANIQLASNALGSKDFDQEFGEVELGCFPSLGS
jgi:hypothetical protein